MELLFKLFSVLNIHGLVRWLKSGKVTILLYHDPSLENFERHVTYLSKHYHFITLTELVDAIYKKDNSSLLSNSMVITFDDGHKNNYYLLPVFKKFKLKPTIYVCSKIVTFKRYYWWEVLKDKKESERLKRIPNKERLEFLKKNYNFRPDQEKADERGSGLSQEEINEMKPFVDFESHTRFHPIITTLTQMEKEDELLGSLEDIRKNININCSAIAYPNGDYSQDDILYLKKIGYKSGRTVDIGWNDINTNPYKLKIIGVSDNASVNKLQFQTTGIFGYINNLRRGGSFTGKKKAIAI
jgi:peptidoglycan/xylan/chitin deacetylase (PgdA/CDA1 family)